MSADSSFPIPPPPGNASLVSEVGTHSRAYVTDASLEDVEAHYTARLSTTGGVPPSWSGSEHGRYGMTGTGMVALVAAGPGVTNVVLTAMPVQASPPPSRVKEPARWPPPGKHTLDAAEEVALGDVRGRFYSYQTEANADALVKHYMEVWSSHGGAPQFSPGDSGNPATVTSTFATATIGAVADRGFVAVLEYSAPTSP